MAFEGTLQDFTVNMHGPELEYSSIEVQQGDTASRRVRIHLKDFGGADFKIPYGATAVFCINKSDGHKVYDACEIEDESTVIVTLSNQAIACAGLQKAQIYLSKDGWDIKTQTFTVNVPRAIYTDDAIKSSDEFGILSELIAEYEAIVDSAGQSAVSAADSAAAAEAARRGIEESLGQISENKDNIAELKSDITDIGVQVVKNAVTEIKTGHYWDNNNELFEHDAYTAFTVKVKGGRTYSFNDERLWSDNFCLIIGKDNQVIGKFSPSMKQTSGRIMFSEMPVNAEYLHLTINDNVTDIVVLEGKIDLSSASIIDYPIGEVIGRNFFGSVYGDVIDNDGHSVSEKVNNLSTIVGKPIRQFLLQDSWILGSVYFSPTNIGNAEGYAIQRLSNMPSGTYYFNVMSAPFTHIVNRSTGAAKKMSELGYEDVYGVETVVVIDYDFDLYLTVTGYPNLNYPMWANGELPIKYKEGIYGVDSEISTSSVHTFYCGSTRKYKTLKSVIEEATKYMDSIVHVDAETFDLVEEFGQEYLDSYSGTSMIGLFLKNRVHVIFANGSKVVFDYQGTNTKVHSCFSPFNSGEYGFTLENAWIESKNCRYSVHDERGHSSDAYHNRYLRCTMLHDSSNCSWGAHQAIGGGLGQFGDILIEDGYYKSVGAVDNISYHNTTKTGQSNAKSKVVVRGAYLDGTTLCANYGTSTEVSQMFVSGCSLRQEPKLERVITDVRADNMEVIAWGNTIRN